MHTTFVGIGSNLQPQDNIPFALRTLLTQFPILHVSTIIQTVPVGMVKTDNQFLNLCVCFESDWEPKRIKQFFDEIEVEQGRNRNDPNRKIKDRPIDLDIMFQLSHSQKMIEAEMIPSEPYTQLPLLNLLDYLEVSHPLKSAELVGVPLWVSGQSIGLEPTTITQIQP